MEILEALDTDKIVVFEPPTLELSPYDLAIEMTLSALVDDLIDRGFLSSMASDIAASVRMRVLTGGR
jgi:hypothetical protein